MEAILHSMDTAMPAIFNLAGGITETVGRSTKWIILAINILKFLIASIFLVYLLYLWSKGIEMREVSVRIDLIFAITTVIISLFLLIMYILGIAGIFKPKTENA